MPTGKMGVLKELSMEEKDWIVEGLEALLTIRRAQQERANPPAIVVDIISHMTGPLDQNQFEERYERQEEKQKTEMKRLERRVSILKSKLILDFFSEIDVDRDAAGIKEKVEAKTEG